MNFIVPNNEKIKDLGISTSPLYSSNGKNKKIAVNTKSSNQYLIVLAYRIASTRKKNLNSLLIDVCY